MRSNWLETNAQLSNHALCLILLRFSSKTAHFDMITLERVYVGAELPLPVHTICSFICY